MEKNMETVKYNGETYRVQSNGRYYSCRRKRHNTRLLHRHVWADAFGAIPEGYVVHHKDENWRNNNITNLEIKPFGKHQSDHMQEWLKDPEYLKQARARMDEARIKASEWHGSEEGKKWHSKHA